MARIDLSIIIVNFNTKELVEECIKSIRKFTKKISYEIIVVENSNIEVEKIKSDVKTKNLRIIDKGENLGFSRGNNEGIKIAKGRYVLFLNSDTLLIEDSLDEMVNWMDNHPSAGAVTSALLNKDKILQTNGGSIPTLYRIFMWATFLDDIPGIANLFGSYHLSVEVPISNLNYRNVHKQGWISGAVFMVRKEVLILVGGFDSDIFMYGEDVELSYRISRAGWEIWYLPQARIIHYGSASSGGDIVKFVGTSIGKRSSILGEFKGLKAFYSKHYPKWKFLFLRLFLKIAAICRIFVLGIIGRQGSVIKIYGDAYKEI